MNITHWSIKNFGSHRALSMDLFDPQLALIYGPTGAGKSTVADAPAWILYGVTAKGGKADEVRPWTSDEPTRGAADVLTASGMITVRRHRAGRSGNDLYWTEQGSDTPVRGKDLADTQRLLEARIGVSKDMFLTTAYLHEFSDTGRFFISSAKERRALLERIAVMPIAVQLGDEIPAHKKHAKQETQDMNVKISKLLGRIEQLEASKRTFEDASAAWSRAQATKIKELRVSAENFETIRANKVAAIQSRMDAFEANRDKEADKIVSEIESADATAARAGQIEKNIKLLESDSKCGECGGPVPSVQKKIKALYSELYASKAAEETSAQWCDRLKGLLEAINPYVSQYEAEGLAGNDYYVRIEEEQARNNPNKAQLFSISEQLHTAESEKLALQASFAQSERSLSALDRLYSISLTLRGTQLQSAVKEIEDDTNSRLERYFDAEIRADMTVTVAGEIDVVLHKSGYECSYTQLSKGQRQLLKLCFSLSVMEAAADRAGSGTDSLTLDEALEGLDEHLRVQAFRMFEDLQTRYSTILVIDHSPGLQQMFSTKYRVILEGDESRMEKENEMP